MKRYILKDGYLEEDKDGNWVARMDAAAELASLRDERDALKYVVKQYSRHDEWCKSKTWLKKDCECGYKKAASAALKGEK
jgi:hypothetical protein